MRVGDRTATRAATGATTLILVSVLMSSGPFAMGASANQHTPSAAAVATAKAQVGTVATQVGIMQAQLVSAQAKVEALGQAVDAASETYNGAIYQLQRARDAAAAAQLAAGKSVADLDSARRDVGRLASAAYRSGGADLGLVALISSSSPENALSAVSTLGVLANRQSGIMDRMNAAKVVAGVLSSQASGALDAVTRAAAAAEAAKRAVEGKVSAQTAQVTAINARVAQLTQSLAAARAQSVQLTQARAIGLARAAAEAVAAAKKSTRKHAHPPTSSGGGRGGGGGSQGATTGAAAAIAFAKQQLGDPYQWGATGPSTWDCSGLTMGAWEAGRVSLPHWAVAQWQVSTPVSAADARPGDLVFYATNLNDFRTIHHVALYLGNGQVIDAPHTGAFVQIESVDGPGFFGFARP